MGSVPGLPLDSVGGGICRDGDRDRIYYRAFLEPGCGIAGELRADWRVRHSIAAFHGAEPRGGAVFLRLSAGSCNSGDGHRQAVAAVALGKFCRDPHFVSWLVR